MTRFTTNSIFAYTVMAATSRPKSLHRPIAHPRFSSSPPFPPSTPLESASCDDLALRAQNKCLSRLIRVCRLHEAQRMFDGLHRRNTVTWNTMIAAHIRNRDFSRARRLFDGMPERDPVSWNTMLSGYAGFAGYFEEARTLFDRMPERDAVSWNTMIAACSRNGRTGEAARLFKAMPGRNAVSWNTLMMGFLENGEVEKAVEVFRGIPSRDSSSLSALVRGLARNNMLRAAEDVLLGLDFTRDGALDAYNTLIAAYGQRGMVMEARQMFDRISHIHKDAVSWNSMSMCYVKTGDLSAARAMFNETPQKDCVSMFN
ncbi:hypothetical protein QJS04_geneDACA019484 [Acorus gramineus]|uniref:Pentatricopeptide repeat-containing protein n=1 Tax=Acorus gramineus TaxID=55184 RepID=A0AAV9AA33_ACOGR|nr:hypothetical protein QJS04_geneDACA019484 [Acorus gramineus]